jgi:hypothetical protein
VNFSESEFEEHGGEQVAKKFQKKEDNALTRKIENEKKIGIMIKKKPAKKEKKPID